MIEIGIGSLFDADVQALVNTVNCNGVMGKGIALEFKKRFPSMFDQYAIACQNGKVSIGTMHITHVNHHNKDTIVFNFPTKHHWQNNSRLDWIEEGLSNLTFHVSLMEIESIAIPALGCSNGGLNWLDVRPLIVKAFEELPNVRVMLFEPVVVKPNVRYR